MRPCRGHRSKSSAKPFPKRTQKTDIAADLVAERRFPMKTVAETLGESRSNLAERMKGRSKPRGPYHKAEDADLLSAIRRLVDQRLTYGYRRIAAILNRERRAADKPVVNAKRDHRIMGNHAMLLEKHTAARMGRIHGKVMVMRSNLRWCSDGLEFTCWNGEVIRLAFIIGAFDREILAWAAVANARISGSDVRDMMLPKPRCASLSKRRDSSSLILVRWMSVVGLYRCPSEHCPRIISSKSDGGR
jgi:putative transposase